MSIQSWKEEFYPVPSRAAAADGLASALAHGIKKWEGARFENLARHGLRKCIREYNHDDHAIKDDTGATFHFDAATCALCRLFFIPLEAHHTQCAGCPLNQKTEAFKYCFSSGQGYDTWLRTGDPEPMIAELKEAEWRLHESAI